MFILEAPYISDLMLKTLEKNQFDVLSNEIAKNYSSKYKLNLIDENTAKNCSKVYSNSENSINWVLNNFQNTDLARLINLCKNKFEFRKGIKSIYPNFFFKEITLEEISKTFDWKSFHRQGIALAVEVKMLLPKSVVLKYSTPFEDGSGILPNEVLIDDAEWYVKNVLEKIV